MDLRLTLKLEHLDTKDWYYQVDYYLPCTLTSPYKSVLNALLLELSHEHLAEAIYEELVRLRVTKEINANG